MRITLGIGIFIILTERWAIEHIVRRAETRWRQRFGK